jgi:hypothetical protein
MSAIAEFQYGSLREKIAAEKAARKTRYVEFEALYAKADAAGAAAATGMTPDTMIVGTPTTLLGNTIDRSKQVYVVPEGPCGFAWITIHPATCSFARWLKKAGKTKGRAYGGGTQIWVSAYGQSAQRKDAYAVAFANVLNAAGIKAYAGGRLD